MKSLLFLAITLYSVATVDYESFVGEVNACLRAFNVRQSASDRYQYDDNQIQRILDGSIQSLPFTQNSGAAPGSCSNRRCADPGIMRIAASVVKEAHDCAKTAVNLRNKYLKDHRGERPFIRNNADLLMNINSGVVAGRTGVRRFGRHFQFTSVIKTLPPERNGARRHDPSQDESEVRSAMARIKAGDMLFFDNVNCRERMGSFLGHVMAVMCVNRDAAGNPVSVDVMEGHLDRHPPTYRTLTIEQIAQNSRNHPGAIQDISCCQFRGFTSWTADAAPMPRARPMRGNARDAN